MNKKREKCQDTLGQEVTEKWQTVRPEGQKIEYDHDDMEQDPGCILKIMMASIHLFLCRVHIPLLRTPECLIALKPFSLLSCNG